MEFEFEWDLNKEKINIKKHKVSFNVASKVFFDPFLCSIQDRVENGEERWQTIGMVDGCLLLLVVHTVLEKDNVEIIRIISARRVNQRERKLYERNHEI